ncbi:hypothetical protein BC835DRAFT_1524625 [Cytidiella melzeri]|nr:hypothetical protein BC835DRAFT_1524625 [Cytidiella melzeri]
MGIRHVRHRTGDPTVLTWHGDFRNGWDAPENAGIQQAPLLTDQIYAPVSSPCSDRQSPRPVTGKEENDVNIIPTPKHAARAATAQRGDISAQNPSSSSFPISILTKKRKTTITGINTSVRRPSGDRGISPVVTRAFRHGFCLDRSRPLLLSSPCRGKLFTTYCVDCNHLNACTANACFLASCRISLPEASLLGIDPSSPVLRDLTVFDIANRDPRLPGIYVYTGDTPHPQHCVQAVGSRTFVYLTDSSEEGKTAAKEAAHSQTVPGGVISDIPGQFEVLPGDAVFACPIDKAGDPAHDCLQIMFGLILSREYTDYMRLLCTSLDRQEHFSRMLDDVEQAKDVMLGSRDRHVKMKGVLAFESSRRAKPMKNAPRCYGLNNMVQQPRNLESPPAPLKTRDNEHDWYQLNVNRYLAATTALNVAAWELQGPSDLLHACREYGEQYIKKEKQLVEQMGHFGGPHEDENDFTAGLSCGLCLSDLSDKPGSFRQRHKQVQDELLQKQFNHYLAGIPLVSHNKYHGWDITAINHGARPKCTDDVDEDYDNEDEDESEDNRKRKANTQDQIDTSKGPNKRGRYRIALQTEVEKRIENDYPMAQSLDFIDLFMQGLPPASPALPSGIHQSVTLPDLRQAHNNPVGYQGNHTLPVPRSVPPRGKHLSPMSDDDSEYEDSNAGRSGRSATSPVMFPPEVGVPVRRSSRIVASSLAAKPTVEPRAANRMVVELSPFRARDRQHCTSPTSTISDVTSTALSTVTSISRQPRTQAVGVVPRPPLLSPSSLSNMTPLPESPSILPPPPLSESPSILSPPPQQFRSRSLLTTTESRRSKCRVFLTKLVNGVLSSTQSQVNSINMQATSGESLRNALNVLDNIDSKTDSLRVLHDPSHAKMPQYSASIFDVRDYCDGTTVWINLYCQRVMLAETRLVDSVQSLVDDTCPGLLQNRVVATRDDNWVTQLTMNVLITVRAGLPITALPTTVPNRPPPPQSLPTANTSTAALSIPEQSSNAIAGSSTTASSIPSTSSSVRAPLSCIIDFLEDACVVATTLANGRTAPSDVCAAQELMYKKPDFLLFLREAAPSRSIMNNLLDQTFAKTRAGLFSLLVFRPGEYNDYLQALFQKFSTHPQDSKFFCNIHALGQPIASRNFNRYTDYWEVANSNDIAWPPSRNFAHAMRDIHKYKLGLGEGKKHLLEGAGGLSEYMLLADMHAAGVVDSPTPDVVGRLVASLAKGGVAGLILLGYTAKGAGRSAVQSAFVKFYEDMRSLLSEDQLQRMQWNPITAEHTLCKFSRMYKKRCYTS